MKILITYLLNIFWVFTQLVQIPTMSETSKSGQTVLFSTEVELFVEALRTFSVEEIGLSK